MNPHIEGTEYQKPLKHYRVGSLEQKKINSANKKDTVFYTDGETNILLRVGAIVPEGFHRGCTLPEEPFKRACESMSKRLSEHNKTRKGCKYRKHGEQIINWKE
jgi:hypothetical protein